MRSYVEGTQNVNELSDLLAAAPEVDIEPSHAALVAGRATLYPDVCPVILFSVIISNRFRHVYIVPPHASSPRRCQSWQVTPRTL